MSCKIWSPPPYIFWLDLPFFFIKEVWFQKSTSFFSPAVIDLSRICLGDHKTMVWNRGRLWFFCLSMPASTKKLLFRDHPSEFGKGLLAASSYSEQAVVLLDIRVRTPWFHSLWWLSGQDLAVPGLDTERESWTPEKTTNETSHFTANTQTCSYFCKGMNCWIYFVQVWKTLSMSCMRNCHWKKIAAFEIAS